VNELDADMVADVQTLEAANDLALCRGAAHPHPRALLRSAGDNPVESLADAGRQNECGGGLAHLALDLFGVVFLLRAMGGESGELGIHVRRGAAGYCGLEQAQGDEIGKPAVWRG